MKRTLLVVALLSLLSSIASAEPTAPPPRDRGTALALSLGATAGSLALIGLSMKMQGHSADELAIGGALSLIVTPSAGEWYAGQPLTVGMGLRTGGAVLMIAGFVEAVQYGLPDGPGGDGPSGALPLIAGGVLFVGGTIYDIVDAPRAADRYNSAHHLTVMPTVMPTPSGIVPGAGIGGTF